MLGCLGKRSTTTQNTQQWNRMYKICVGCNHAPSDWTEPGTNSVWRGVLNPTLYLLSLVPKLYRLLLLCFSLSAFLRTVLKLVWYSFKFRKEKKWNKYTFFYLKLNGLSLFSVINMYKQIQVLSTHVTIPHTFTSFIWSLGHFEPHTQRHTETCPHRHTQCYIIIIKAQRSWLFSLSFLDVIP